MKRLPILRLGVDLLLGELVMSVAPSQRWIWQVPARRHQRRVWGLPHMAMNPPTRPERFVFAFGFVLFCFSKSAIASSHPVGLSAAACSCAAFSPSTVMMVPSLHSTRTLATGTPASLALLMARITSLRLKRFGLRRPIA